MSDHTNDGSRIDYLKFVVPMDWDLGQQEMTQLKGRIETRVELQPLLGNYKISVLGITKDSNGRSRYVVEAWGAPSILLGRVVPLSWFEHLCRIDVRSELRSSTIDNVRAYVQQLSMSSKGKRNISTFNSRSRQKTATRDVGGFGVTIGSRKSDAHTVVYARGEEGPCIEVRLQGRRAADIGMQLIQDFDNGLCSSPEFDIPRIAEQAWKGEMYKATGMLSTDALQMQMVIATAQMAQVQQAMDFVETEAEKAYWNSLTTEEQDELQRQRFVPTSLFNGPKIIG